MAVVRPDDPVTLADAAQAGARGIVSALHQYPPGAAWPAAEIAARQRAIADSPGALTWQVVESVPVSEAIKTRSGPWRAHIDAYIETLHNLAGLGIRTVTWNFMPVVDWTRTDLAYPRPCGAQALRFDPVALAAFDIHILERPGAADQTPAPLRRAAAAYADALDGDGRERLTQTVIAGLPGANDGWTLDGFLDRVLAYADIGAAGLRANLIAFVAEIAPVAEALGLALAAHPDDPPWPLLGMPRVLSTEADYAALFDAVPSPANGICFCTGSLGARADNDLLGMIRRFAPRIHFAHLRNVRREAAGVLCAFFEDAHLAGSTDMIAVLKALLEVEADRIAGGPGRSPCAPIMGRRCCRTCGPKAGRAIRRSGVFGGWPSFGGRLPRSRPEAPCPLPLGRNRRKERPEKARVPRCFRTLTPTVPKSPG